jgi:FK506-binding nuclear protein
MALTPMALYGLEIPPGDVALSARPDIPSAFRITMAAIDPSAEAEGDEGAVPRATLKVIRQSLLADDDDDDSDDFDQEAMERMLAEDYSGEDSEESSDDEEEVNGGPSDPAKTKKARKEAAKLDIQKLLEEEDGMEMDDESDEDVVPNGVNGILKSKKALGKMPAGDEDDDEDSEMDEEFVEEYVICTLDPAKVRLYSTQVHKIVY